MKTNEARDQARTIPELLSACRWARDMFNLAGPFHGLVGVTTQAERVFRLNALNAAIQKAETQEAGS